MSSKVNVSTLVSSEILSGILISVAFAMAICVANIDLLAQLYKNFISLPISFGYCKFTYQSSLINLVNDGLMTLFFLLIGLELKFHLVCGEYKDTKTLALPTAAAVGGIVVPALFYLYFNFGTSTAKGWAIPIATDTAFMLGVLSLFSRNIPAKLRAFIIGFSLIDDAIALLILAIFYTKSLNAIAMVISVILLAILFVLNRQNVRNLYCYIVVGIFLWISMVEAGIHGTLCGAIFALTIPVQIEGQINDSFHKLENVLRPFVHFFILPLFVFINSGISFDSLSYEVLTSNITIGIIVGLFIGKQLGLLSFSYFAIKMKLCSLPQGVNWSTFYGISILGGIGFTLSLFIGDLTFEDLQPHYAMRVGVIIGSTLSAFLGSAIILLAQKRTSKNNSIEALGT
ncbi:MAG: Na+/H+ antiporter NhaA [Candidatus Lariskella arthropodorum]